jgi:LAO/AO transport system kinase
VVLVETVGVGQSEIAVAEMVDSFLLLTLARAGDQLQGIKKGVLELADVIAVNKADGPHTTDATAAARELAAALRLLHGADGGWQPPVLTCSARETTGLTEIWAQLTRHRDTLIATGELGRQRSRQQVGWVWALVRATVLDEVRAHPAVAALTPEVEHAVLAGTLTPTQAATRLLSAFTR